MAVDHHYSSEAGLEARTVCTFQYDANLIKIAVEETRPHFVGFFDRNLTALTALYFSLYVYHVDKLFDVTWSFLVT